MNAMDASLWGVGAFILTIGTVAALQPLARRIGLVDHPAGRKDHAVPTPVTGGIAMLVAVLVCGAFMFDALGRSSMGFALAAIMLVVMGALDDRYDLPWWLRLLGQVAAALVLVYVGGIRIDNLGSMFGVGLPTIGAWSVPFTVFAIVGAINAVNMADGADGLAGLLVLSCLAMVAISAFHVGNTSVYLHMPILMGAVAGFLVFNLRWQRGKHASVFMGNSGSALLGLVIAAFVIRLTQEPHHSVAPVLALWVLPVPLIDCLVLMVRRLRHGHSPFSPDHNHVHYLMREAGFGPTRSVLVLSVFSFACWLLAWFALGLGTAPVVVFGAFVCLCLAWFWVTGRRARAVGMFRHLRRFLGGREPVAVPAPEQASSE